MTLSMTATTAQPIQLLSSKTLASIGQAPNDNGDGKLSKTQLATIDKASQQFEGVFMSEMLKPMFQTVKTDSMFGGGEAEDSYRNLMVQQMGKEVAANGGIGLAKFVKAEMIKLQEGAHKS